jgi:hypothetical protein
MNMIERLEIESECRRLVSDYCHYWDARDIEAWLTIYHEDMVFEVEGSRPVEGLAKLAASLAKRPPSGPLTRHASVNVVVDVIDSENATGRCAMLFFRSEPVTHELLAPQAISDFAFRFVKTGDGWKILRRYSRRHMGYEPAEQNEPTR